MNNSKKIIISLVGIMMTLCFYVACSSSQDKPSDEVIKQTILHGYSKGINNIVKSNKNIKISDLKFDSFKIKNGLVSETKGNAGESAPYNIVVDYKISYVESQDLAKWKADHIKQAENNILMAKKDLEGDKLTPNKSGDNSKIKALIDYNKKVIVSNTANIEIIKKYPDVKKSKKEIVKNNEQMSFIKKGGKWYGYVGWK